MNQAANHKMYEGEKCICKFVALMPLAAVFSKHFKYIQVSFFLISIFCKTNLSLHFTPHIFFAQGTQNIQGRGDNKRLLY